MGRKAVVLLSGGLDSSCLTYRMIAHRWSLLAVSANYGQRHKREVEAALAIATRLEIEWLPIDLSSVGSHLEGNALTGQAALPQKDYSQESLAVTVVPLRNALFLTAASAIALARGYETVAIGVHGGDHPVYPDCRAGFITAYQAMVDAFTEGRKLEIQAPFLHQQKSDIVAVGARLGVPFELTWSCYAGGEIHCGLCSTCRERREAFRLAGVPDPTQYAA